MSNRRKWLISLGHSFVLLILSLLWLNSPYNYGDENFLIKWSEIVKQLILRADVDPPKSNFLFINLAHEKALIPLEDQLGNEVITDREALTKFFLIQKSHPNVTKFTICDVLMQGKSEHDSLFVESISGNKNIIFPNNLDDDQIPLQLDVKVPNAVANYRNVDEEFMKFELFQGADQKTIPVYLYEKIDKHVLTSHYGFIWDKGKPCLNSLIIDYQIRPNELLEQNEYPMVNLSELLLLPEDIIVKDFLQNKIVIMGDFEHDVHNTTFGSMPGSLILLNVYLSIQSGFHKITIAWLIFMILSFTLFSKMMIFRVKKKEDAQEDRNSKWLSKLLQNTVMLSIISVSSYFLFNISIQVLFLVVYTSIFIFIQQKIQEKIPFYSPKYWLAILLKK